ncbi:SUMF1/EgtB/PvdO family nonheme iron enzyme [Tropicimonas sp. IMCC6043]|uniref:SUMF1/EgtB/PvdO family nonheme iron enzyme n=1 Tax=Tropicimonas sp. IMCC6043 TaxID=2510645 RepID=UPI0013EC5EA6|nr:SUMF1/EgtB/PvdO family nonheme iron enzyme [Tropicimonas sp. IMCC6043]
MTAAVAAVFLLFLLAGAAVADKLEEICDGHAPENGLCEVRFSAREGPPWPRFARLFGKTPFGQSIAVVIGIGDYESAYADLPGRTEDAQRMRDFLLGEAGFDLVVLLTDRAASRARLERLLTEVLPPRIGPDDRFLFHYSGHGETRSLAGGRKRGYLVTSQARSRTNWSAMVSMESIQAWSLDLARARHGLWVVDACFSGLAGAQTMSAPRRTTLARLSQRAHHILTAGLEDEEALIVNGRSLFTNAFIDAARNADLAAGGDPDGFVSLQEIQIHIARTLDREIERLNSRRLGRPYKMSPRVAALHDDDGAFFFEVPLRSGEEPVASRQDPAPPSDVVSALGAGAGGGAAQSPRPDPPRPADLPEAFSDCAGCPEMVVLPAGAFEMGADFGSDVEKPKHPVVIGSPFAMSRTEVTHAEWDLCESDLACPPKAGAANHPVTGVTWEDLDKYLAWIGRRSGAAYRLPTEVEWEYAARGGMQLKFPTGPVAIPGAANFGDLSEAPVPVASYKANAFDLHDLSGNVWEWTANCATAYLDGLGGTVDDSPTCTGVLRGGSWRSPPEETRASNRFFYPRGQSREDFGFRVVRPLSTGEPVKPN